MDVKKLSGEELSQLLNDNPSSLSLKIKDLVCAINMCDESSLDTEAVYKNYSILSRMICQDFFASVNGVEPVLSELYPKAVVALTRLNSILCSTLILSRV